MKRRTFRRATRKPRDLVWVTTLIGSVVAENTYEQDLLTSGTWEANANNFERATLLTIRGWLCWNQYAASTNVEVTGLWIAIIKQGLNEITVFDPKLAGDYDQTDVLWTWGVALGESSNGDNSTLTDSKAFEVKTKRKLTSGDKITLVASMDADAATPAGNLMGVARILVDRA